MDLGKPTKNADSDKYKYNGYDIGCDSRSEFPLTGISTGRNVVIFGADMSSYVHVHNIERDILILREGQT